MESSVSPCATPSGPATRQTPQPGSFAGSTASLAMPLSDSQARKEASSGGAAAGAAEVTVPRAEPIPARRTYNAEADEVAEMLEAARVDAL